MHDLDLWSEDWVALKRRPKEKIPEAVNNATTEPNPKPETQMEKHALVRPKREKLIKKYEGSEEIIRKS